MKIVKNKTLKKDLTMTRAVFNDSPLRYPMNVHMTDTHERRIDWLQYENSQICREYLSAMKENRQLEIMEMYRLNPDGSEEKVELYGFRVEGEFRTTEFFHLDNGGTERTFAMTKMAHPQLIIEE